MPNDPTGSSLPPPPEPGERPPPHRAPATAAAGKTAAGAPPERALRILVAEDEEGSREVAARLPSCDVPGLLAAYDQNVGFVGTLAELLFQLFRDELPPLRAAVTRQDAAEVTRRAHRLKGAVGNLRGEAAHAIAESLEQQARAGNLALLPALLAELESECPRLQRALQDVIGGTARSA